MKVGILTYHKSFNNGAVLQAYATQKAVKKLGHEAMFVDVYKEPRSLKSRLVYLPKDLRSKRFYARYYDGETPYFPTIDDLRRTDLDVDCLLVGSDQTWNPDINRDMLKAMFLDFGGDGVRRVSYASSIGRSDWPETAGASAADISRLLGRFSAISVRENTAADILRNSFGIDSAKVVVDPTLLHDNFDEITGPVVPNHEVVCYLFGRLPWQLEVAKRVGQAYGVKPRLISNLYPLPGFRYTYPPVVEKWIRLIGGADCVVTDSFHGMVFSILYRRDFILVPQGNGRTSRMTDLLDALGIAGRVFHSLEEYEAARDSIPPIDYDAVAERLARLKAESWDYLRNALS